MSIAEAVILGLLQALGEFLPISSSAHLVLLPFFRGVQYQGVSFDVMLHLATLLAVLLYFAKDWFVIIKDGLTRPKTREGKTLWLLALATVPAGLAGVLAGRADINLKNVVIIGCAQALALMPGVSRSGITITAALFLGFSRSQSARISFLLSAPVIGGAAVLELAHLSLADITAPLVWGFISAFLGALLVIGGLMKYIKTHSFNVFVVYRLLLGLVIFGWYWHLH